jgi:hypothetical protein
MHIVRFTMLIWDIRMETLSYMFYKPGTKFLSFHHRYIDIRIHQTTQLLQRRSHFLLYTHCVGGSQIGFVQSRVCYLRENYLYVQHIQHLDYLDLLYSHPYIHIWCLYGPLHGIPRGDIQHLGHTVIYKYFFYQSKFACRDKNIIAIIT